MPTTGPIPKLDDQRRRRNLPEGPAKVTGARTKDVRPPAPDPKWHPIAANWYLALQTSGQSYFFEPSDWAEAVYVAEVMHVNLMAGKFSAFLFQAVMSASARLMTTEGDRRRLRVELKHDVTQDDEAVVGEAEYRRKLS